MSDVVYRLRERVDALSDERDRYQLLYEKWRREAWRQRKRAELWRMRRRRR